MAAETTSQTRRTLIAGGGALALLGAAGAYAVEHLIPLFFDIGKETYQLRDGERDFVFKVVDLEARQDKDHLVAVANLVQSTTDQFIRDKKTAEAIKASLATYAQTMAGEKIVEEQNRISASGSTPTLGQAAALVGQAQLADQLGAETAAPPIAATVGPPPATKAGQSVTRVFFQVARPDDRPIAEATMSSLSSLGPAWHVASGIEIVPRYTGPTEVRYFFQQDRDNAAKLAARLSTRFPDVKCIRIAGYDVNGRVNPLLFEVWLKSGAQATTVPAPERAVACL